MHLHSAAYSQGLPQPWVYLMAGPTTRQATSTRERGLVVLPIEVGNGGRVGL